jgi:hypothetical protein
LLLTCAAYNQSKTNDTILRQIRKARADKTTTLTYDSGSNMSKIMVVAENFPDNQADAAGVRAMNFAAGFFYPGQEITKAPEQIMLTFWIMSGKPRFAEYHRWTVYAGQETVDLGEARYAAKPRTDMEYLNFNIGRGDLAKIAAGSNVRFKLGEYDFSFSRDQLKALADLLVISDPALTN